MPDDDDDELDFGELTKYLEPDEIKRLSKLASLTQAKMRVAAVATTFAKSISPVGDAANDPHPGYYRNAIRPLRKGRKVWVFWGAGHSNLVEYGSIHNQEYAIRQRTEDYMNGQDFDFGDLE